MSAIIFLLCSILFTGFSYLYIFPLRQKVQNETESEPYYSPSIENAGIMFDILGDKTYFYLNFEDEEISVIYADNIEYEDEIFGYPIDYTVSSNFDIIGGIVDGVGGINLQLEGENLAFTGVQVVELLEKTADRAELRRVIVDEIISSISRQGFTREQFLYIIENSETNLTFPKCYYWSEYMKEICKLKRVIN